MGPDTIPEVIKIAFPLSPVALCLRCSFVECSSAVTGKQTLLYRRWLCPCPRWTWLLAYPAYRSRKLLHRRRGYSSSTLRTTRAAIATPRRQEEAVEGVSDQATFCGADCQRIIRFPVATFNKFFTVVSKILTILPAPRQRQYLSVHPSTSEWGYAAVLSSLGQQ